MRRRRTIWLIAALAWTGAIQVGTAAAPPALLPPGWTAHHVPDHPEIIKYVSPDGRAVLTLRDMQRQGQSIANDIDRFTRRPGESVTYQRHGRLWVVVSGYRGDQIFYRRADLSCGGRRWHLLELTYPRSDKQRMDPTVTQVSHRLENFRNVCPGR